MFSFFPPLQQTFLYEIVTVKLFLSAQVFDNSVVYSISMPLTGEPMADTAITDDVEKNAKMSDSEVVTPCKRSNSIRCHRTCSIPHFFP